MQYEEDKLASRRYGHKPVPIRWDEEYLKRRKLLHQLFKPSEPLEAARLLAFELRRVRKARGISLAEVAAQTLISKRSLEAIESGKLEDLPGGFYLRNYLRSYARHLQFDDSVVQKAFSTTAAVTAEIVPRFSSEPASYSANESFVEAKHRSRLPKFGEYLLYFILSKSERISVIGDLEEEFAVVQLKFGETAARIYFHKQVITSVLPFMVKSGLRFLSRLVTFDWE
jgi:transcriptional regulator with XRE-family HTH domain